MPKIKYGKAKTSPAAKTRKRKIIAKSIRGRKPVAGKKKTKSRRRARR